MRRSLIILVTSVAATAAAQDSPAHRTAREILAELVSIPSTESGVGSTPAAEAVARRLRAAGFPAADVQVVGPNPRKQNLVARLHGTGKGRPILLLSHLDVVEAPKVDWSTDPFQLVEKDGYFYGRGVYDVKEGGAILVANLLRWKQEGWRPSRDVIVALTADEEGGPDNGVEWLLAHRRDLIDAAYCLNTDGGDFYLGPDGQPLSTSVQLAEKWSINWKLEVVNPGGHSSRPRPDNALYQLAAALLRIQKLRFPAQLNAVARGYFAKESPLVGGATGADMRAAAAQPPDPAALDRLSENPFYNALIRTTCVATMAQAGHASNALPQQASATVNCRALPEMTIEQVRQALTDAIADPQVKLGLAGQPSPGPASVADPAVMSAMDEITSQMWPGRPVIPVMDVGASDGKYLRAAGLPTFGVSGVFVDPNDKRAHGRDERVGVQAVYWGVDFYDRLVRRLAR